MTDETRYERLGDRAARGEYELVEPLDYLLLGELPEAGTMLAGLYQIGSTVAELEKKFPLTSSQIHARIRSLHVQGLVVKVKTFGTGAGKWSWQRSEEGSALVDKWKETQSE